MAKPPGEVARKQNADFSDKISTVIKRISDAWSAATAASDHVTLEELRKTVARYDRVLSDLQDQERLAAEDATIHVKIKRKRSSSPPEERKRHCDSGQLRTCPESIGCLASIGSNEEASVDALEHTKTANSSHEVLQPKTGELYLVLHKQSQLWLTALILPLADLHTIGISATAKSLGLSKNLPSCVVYNIDSEQFEWRDGYADGEMLAHKRRFPVTYFSGPEVPKSSVVEWVAAEDLRMLDRSSIQSPVPYHHVVRAFLERRTGHRALRATARSLDPPLAYNEGCKTSDRATFNCQKTSPTPKIPTTVHLDGKLLDEPQPIKTRSSGFTLEHRLPNPSDQAMNSPQTSPLADSSCPRRPVLCALRSKAYSRQHKMLSILDANALPGITDVKEDPKDIMLPGPISLFKDENGARFGLFQWSESLPQRLIDLLAKKSQAKGVKPLPCDFKNGRGLLCCPLCSRIREFVRVASFTSHLLEKHSW